MQNNTFNKLWVELFQIQVCLNIEQSQGVEFRTRFLLELNSRHFKLNSIVVKWPNGPRDVCHHIYIYVCHTLFLKAAETVKKNERIKEEERGGARDGREQALEV